jgi:FecR protein
MKTGKLLAVLLFAVTMLTAGVSGQDYGPGPSGPNGESARSDGPQPDVARVSLIHGDVSMQRGDTGDWEVTSINAPLVRGDQVATGETSRTEIQLDYADIVRLAARSQVKIADLTRTRIQLQVAQGYVNFTQLKGSEADVEIDTPNVAVRPLKHGRYRVQVNSDSETDVIVREGEAEITTPQGSTRVKEGEVIQIRGEDNPEYKIAGAPRKDEWDSWNKDRDKAIKEAASWGRTNRYYTGANDLDAYGHWVWVPGYGNVWQPYYTSAGWAPYQAGRWVWEPYWGWTWVSYEPWGWAPYHYGRWFYYGNSWCWWPGPVYVSYRPVWSPAFVFFVGFGHHSSFGFGSIGWFPVGPHDPFFPWWGRGFNRVNVVNVTNITNITNITNVTNVHNVVPPLAVRGRQPYYSNVNMVQNNVRVRGSITTVSSEDFGRGNFSNRHFGVGENEWREGRLMTANVPVVPSRENLRVAASGNVQAGATVQPRNTDRFYTRHQPPAGPESFHTQVERVQRVVTPDAVHASTNMGGSAQVERRDGGATVGGNAAVRGNAEVPRTGGANTGAAVEHGNGRLGATEGANAGAGANNEGGKENSRGSFRRFGSSGPNNGGNTPGGPSRTSSANERVAQNTPADNSGSNAGNPAGGSAQENKRDRSGWSRFGSGRSGDNSGNRGSLETTSPSVKSNDQGSSPRSDSSTAPDSRRSGGNPNWQKFPSSGDRSPAGGSNDRPSAIDRTSQPDKTATPAQTPHTQEDRGWQHFPANGSGRDSSMGRTDSGGGKPPLELHRPIVTPREDTRSTPREEPRTYSPPPRPSETRTAEPRYTPPPSRGSDGPRGGGYSPRSESPRYSPPSRSSEPHGGSGSHEGSSSSHGSGDRGGHSESKSSSPKH